MQRSFRLLQEIAFHYTTGLEQLSRRILLVELLLWTCGITLDALRSSPGFERHQENTHHPMHYESDFPSS